MTRQLTMTTGSQTLAATQKEAQIRGTKTYFTGIECVHGHVSLRFTSSGQCTACLSMCDRKVQDHGNVSVKRRIDAIKEPAPYKEVWED
jgi:hypothetical protein